MSGSPPVSPAPKANRRVAGGGGNQNSNYVQIVNSFKGTGIVHRRDALHLIKQGRAEVIGKRQIKLTEHPTNVREREAAARQDEAMDAAFVPYRGSSDGFAMWKARRAGEAQR